MTAKKVMVVDDSALIRKLVCDTLSGRADIETSIAQNGLMALEKMPKINPDLVILDVEMPGLDGLETLEGLLKINPRLRVIMFSALTEKGAGVSMDALARGASDCLAKPTSQGSAMLGLEFLRRELLPRVESLLGISGKILASKQTISESQPRPNLPSANPLNATRKPKQSNSSSVFDILTIASSTGGPNALHAIFEALPINLPVPVVCVQHMPPLFTKLLAERLSKKSLCKAHEVKPGEVLMPGNFYLAPGDFHFELAKNGEGIVTTLHQGPPENSCRPAADVLFRSVAKLYGNRALGIVLTGMGQDGLLGCKELKQQGGYLLAQDEATSVVWGMPGAVTKAGLVDEVCAVGEIAARLVTLLSKRS
jgi:two-component system, chemotaxis family, protein-glutamate methylesterase/glutaminase